MKEKMRKMIVQAETTIKEAIKRMDDAGERILFVVDNEDKLLGTITDGDIRRWILKEGGLSESVSNIYNKSPVDTREHFDLENVKKMMLARKIEAMPITNHNNQLVDVLFWSDLFSESVKPKVQNLRVPVLVMAGGKGTRLDPLTKFLPKPLIPFGDKPIVEIIMDRFCEFGWREFYLTVHYKGKMIQSYFDHADCNYKVKVLWEEEPMGTAGSLRLALPHIDAPHLFVSNCDIIIKADYADIFEYHKSNNNDLTIIGSIQHVSVPYGVLEMVNGGALQKIVEKPEFDFLANTGMYVIKRDVIGHIPDSKKFDFTDLILKVKEVGGKVGVYPVSQQSWVDIGQWQEYSTALKGLDV